MPRRPVNRQAREAAMKEEYAQAPGWWTGRMAANEMSTASGGVRAASQVRSGYGNQLGNSNPAISPAVAETYNKGRKK